MAYSPLFSGAASPKGNYHETITLMSYVDNADPNNPLPARKYCYIIKHADLQGIFRQAGVPLTPAPKKDCHRNSFWNRRHPVKGAEYGVEICQDDDGTASPLNPVYLVYANQWLFNKVEAQHCVHSGILTPDQAIKLDTQLTKYDANNAG